LWTYIYIGFIYQSTGVDGVVFCFMSAIFYMAINVKVVDMLEALKKILAKLPIPGLRSKVLQVSHKTSQALRQLIRSYQRQKRLWIYIILSSVSLMVMYTLFGLLWVELWDGGGVVPVVWIILAGVGIAIYQVRRCNDVIQTLRQAYTVQIQIEKAEEEKAEEENAEEEKEQKKKDLLHKRTLPSRPLSNGSQISPDE
jgi:hypothetical protein